MKIGIGITSLRRVQRINYPNCVGLNMHFIQPNFTLGKIMTAISNASLRLALPLTITIQYGMRLNRIRVVTIYKPILSAQTSQNHYWDLLQNVNTNIVILLPGQNIFNDGEGEGRGSEVYILYPKKSQLQNLSTQKKPYSF